MSSRGMYQTVHPVAIPNGIASASTMLGFAMTIIKTMTKLTKKETKHIAKLAKLDIGEEETEGFSGQLSSILDFVKKLETLETKEVRPLSNVTGKKNVFREDKVKPSLSQEEVLSGTKQKHKGYFKVKAIFNNETF